MNGIERIPFTELNDMEIRDVYEWRVSPFVRLRMAHAEMFTFEDHQEFIKGLGTDSTTEHFLIKEKSVGLGVITVNRLSRRRAELGLYKNPSIKRKGIGRLLLDDIEGYATSQGICELVLKVLKENAAAIRLYQNYHYQQTSEDENFYYMKKRLNQRVLIVAELSANHNHDIEIAKSTIRCAAEAGADAVKLQTYTADTLTIDCAEPPFLIDNGSIWDGRTFYDLYKEAYTPWEWHQELYNLGRDIGLEFFSTPFDSSAVDFLETLNNPIYKIASFEIRDIPLIEYCATRGKPMILSTGVAEFDEIQDAVDACRRSGNEDITLLKCTSSYPAPIEAANLRTMVDMKETFGTKVGLSDHTVGGEVAIAATALGAELIEKHFILDRNNGGPDSSFSMEPDEFAQMVSSIRNAELSLGQVSYELSDQTRQNRKFSRSLFVVEDVKDGEEFSNKNVRSIRPGDGISPKHIGAVLGTRAVGDIARGTPLTWEMIDQRGE